jgi:CRP/FNR family transcriptional regulator, anaerobic regulatory protein
MSKSSDDSYTSFLNHIRRYITLSAEDEAFLLSRVYPLKVKSKQFIMEEGEVCIARYFVSKGCVRMYLNTDYGTDQVIQFAIDNWWMADYNSLEMQRPSVHYIQAVEPSELIVLEKKVQEELFRKILSLERYFRIIYQRAYTASLSRIHFILNLSGEERYKHFSTSFPDFVQRVPQYMLASYLGFTPEFLSKIRAKKD